MDNQYPDTAEKRRAGMAAFRARMLAAHERQVKAGNLKPADLELQHVMIATIRAAQTKFGEV